MDPVTIWGENTLQFCESIGEVLSNLPRGQFLRVTIAPEPLKEDAATGRQLPPINLNLTLYVNG